MQALEISRTGMDVEWRRLEVIAENLANVQSAASTKGGVYRPLHLLVGPKNDFATLLKEGAAIDTSTLAGVAERGVVASDAPPRLVHEPGNPLADAQGFVAYPAIDQASEMTQMVETVRIYEANLVAANTAREMYSKALQLGSRNP
jgi:flagellar basal-body rod protein FlgC